MYGDPKSVTTAERKLSNLVQHTSAIEYTVQFQTLAAQVEWNQEALMAQYRRGLKVKVRHTIIPIEDATTIRELID
jgi:Retrotransposon gag protein